MTVMAAEAATGGEAASTVTATRANTAQAARGASGARGTAGRPGGTGQRGQRGRSGTSGQRGRQGQPAKQQPQRRQPSRAREIRRRIPTTPAHRANYQGVILAEFVAAIVLTAITPFAAKGKPRSGLSPYAGQDVLQLVAIVAVYLILALISMTTDGAARVSAWFGALILLAVGLGGAARLAGLTKLLGGSSAPGTEGEQPSAGEQQPTSSDLGGIVSAGSDWVNFGGPLPEVIG